MKQEVRADKMCGKRRGEGDWLGRLAISGESVEDSFAFGIELATGGFGSVRNLTEIRSKRQAYVCKTLSKTRSEREHIEGVRRVNCECHPLHSIYLLIACLNRLHTWI